MPYQESSLHVTGPVSVVNVPAFAALPFTKVMQHRKAMRGRMANRPLFLEKSTGGNIPCDLK